jgi:uncharacterized protein
LDAVGAIGIMRTISTGTKMGSPFYGPAGVSEDSHIPVDNNMVDHFYIKTLKLGEGMNTATARAVATERTEYMRRFLKQLEGELSGIGI